MAVNPFQAMLPATAGANRLPAAARGATTTRAVVQPAAPSPFASGATAPYSAAAAFQPPPSELGKAPVMPSLMSPQANAAGATKAGSPVRAPATPTLAPKPAPAPIQPPGNNLVNPGYTEQAFETTQNRLLEDPFSSAFQGGVQHTQTPTQGENYMNQNLGTLDGPGQGDQYWNQVQGQFQSPFAGEQFTREATQNFSPTGAAGAFNTQAQGRSDQFTNFTGAGNSQSQFGQSSSSLAGGTQGEQGLGQIAGQYDQLGQYTGQNNAQGQFQQNAQSGNLAGQQFFDSVKSQAGTTGKYSDPNLAAGQYAQTQQAFGDLPVAEFDPFYDRARQLGVQSYNRDAAGRGVYGSSEALSGVGNVITDIEAQRANRSFDAEMQRAQEQRMRQGLLGEQARQGDLSSLAGFGANLAGLETFGGLANQAGNQTLGQQTMLGNQARQSDLSATDAFGANLQGASTFANINQAQGALELDRNQLLGNMANNADTQALGTQNANIRGLESLGDIAGQADTAETNRFNASTGAMNDADRTGISRFQTGADIAFRGDENARGDFTASNNAANQAANLDLDRTRLGADIANVGSDNDLGRLDSFNDIAGGAEDDRQGRLNTTLASVAQYTGAVQNVIKGAQDAASSGEYASANDYFEAMVLPAMQEAGYDQQKIDTARKDTETLFKTASKTAEGLED